jgi:hypothetical protein
VNSHTQGDTSAPTPAHVLVDEPAVLGRLHDTAGTAGTAGTAYSNIEPCARLRLTVPVTRIGLAVPQQTAALLGFGEAGDIQVEQAAKLANNRPCIPASAPGPVMEIPLGGMAW